MPILQKKILLIVSLMFLHLYLQAQKDSIVRRIVLIGDGGSLTKGKHPVKDAVRKLIPMDSRTTVVFLGDNIYPAGLQDEEIYNYSDGKAALDSQLSIADSTQSRVYMIPGNHDWDEGRRSGWQGVMREQLYVDYFSGKDSAKFYPKDGCPGPVEISLGNDVTLIIFDSQWWLHPYDKPGIESDCDCKTQEELAAQIKDIVQRNSKKLVVIASHHPFKSNGPHGGYYTLKQHLFPLTDISRNLYLPLPLIGSIYPIARGVFGTPQDLKHPNYQNMIKSISDAARSHPNVVFVAGHEHTMQYHEDSSFHYIVSGSGCKATRVSKSKKTPYVSDSTGFAVMEVYANKDVSVTFYTVTDSARKSYSTHLLNFSAAEELAKNAGRPADIADIIHQDTVNRQASVQYPPLTGLRKFFLGQNYRYEWSKPVNMKVFKINEAEGGLTVTGMGGGKQTKSLRLKDKSGKEWVLRALDKNPTKALPENFRGTLAQDVVQEYNSASHPYAALTIPPMAKILNIRVPKPQLFFVPDDPRLGIYQDDFANTVCMLEERDPSIDGTDTRSTMKIFYQLLDDNDHRVDEPTVLRARLLDILVGDFDRHFDQWKWGTGDTGKGKLYYPIPRDRDQVYFNSDGQLLKYVSKNIAPFLKGFHHDIPDVDWLGYSAKDFDRLFLTDLDRQEWEATAAYLQQNLNDSVIREAVQKLPPEIYAINGETIINKLISRRNILSAEALKYYSFISRYVNVLGSNQKEYFKVSNYGAGLQVRVYAREKGNDTSFVMYSRIFSPAETKEIRLYGLNDDDIFDIEENASSSIKIRIIGGKGNDTFNIRGRVRNLLYDMKKEGNFIKNESRTKNRFSVDPPVNAYSILGYNYKKSKFPQTAFSYNSDDGLLAGLGFSRTTHGFRNLPYATNQNFSALYSITRNAYRLDYSGEFNHITRNADIVLGGHWLYPALSNFFGLGNQTKPAQSISNGFYRSRFRVLELQALFRHRYFDKFHVSIGPYFYHYDSKYKDNAGKVLGNPSLLGLDSADIYSKKTYLGGKLALRIDNRNNQLFPTRGVIWNTELVSVAGLGKGSDPFTKFTSDMTIYASFTDPAKVVAVIGLGGGRIYNKNFEYFQALSIGAGNNNIHGFVKNRYMGRSSAYGSFELRVKLFDIKSYILPGAFGLTGFYDAGRVWQKNETSRKWHSAVGGGFYFIPFNLFMISGSVGVSEKEKVFNFTLGSKINLVY